ncbi:MAG: Ig-like domain-containing protein [Treponema sp.]|nr:Ig-like domain-containing protein [Treponema sp.]
MRKRTLAITIFICAISAIVYAGGRQDNESREVASPEGFTESIDITDKSPGKWNIYVEAQDKGGNTAIAGPHNIYIDPESDLPIARIINPQSNMHVQGNLNIVGTCTDDDGVAYVEMVITRGADGKGEVMLQTRADGTEFWSCLLDTSDTQKWRDGVYTITAWGTDINGLSGISDSFPVKSQKKDSVTWNLDRKKPEIKVTSHELGALLNGKVNIKGNVWDGNGVDTLSYSLDNGIRYQSASLKYDKNTDLYNFDIPIDTKAFEDGPAVILFKSRDKMKTEGSYSFLIFANNTGPDVQILYPDPETAVNGIFTVAGYAIHKVGLSSLTWKLGKDSGEIPLIIGNPWWSQEFDIRGQNVKDLDLEIRATDLSGNVTTVKRKLLVDQEADKPKISLTSPADGAIVPAAGLPLIGLATDNTGVESIFYSIGTNPAVEVPCSGYFQLTINDEIQPGIYNMDVWAKDITGVIGPKVTVKNVVFPGIAPELTITQVRTAVKTAEPAQFYSGMEINSESGSSMDLLIRSGSGLQNISYQLGSKNPVTIAVKGTKGGDYIQNITIPPDIDFGQVKLEIRANDIYNRETILNEYVNITDLTSRRIIDGYVSANKLRDGAISLKGLNGEASWPGQITVSRDSKTPIPVSASVDSGAQPAKMTFNIPGRAPINGTFKDGEIQANLPADLPAGLNQVTLAVDMRTGEHYEATGEFWLLRPRLDGQTINTAQSFTWLRPETLDSSVILLSNITPLTGIYNGRPLQSVTADGTNTDTLKVSLDQYGRVSLLGSGEGTYGPVRFILTDRDGKTFTSQDYSFLVDNGPPVIEILDNIDGKWVQNQVNLRFRVTDGNSIKSLEFSANLGTNWSAFNLRDGLDGFASGSIIENPLDISALGDGVVLLSIRAIDAAGRQTISSFSINKDTKAPATRLIVPISGARVNGNIMLGIAVTEAGKLDSVVYNRPETEIDGVLMPEISKQVYPVRDSDGRNKPFTFLDVILDKDQLPLADNMSFTFTDAAGNSSTISNWPFIIDTQMDLPVVQVSLPLDNEVIISDFEISGICYDDDQVNKIYWSIDGGNEQALEAKNGYSITIPLSSMTDNGHTVTVYAEDIYGVKGEPVTRDFRVSLEEPKAMSTAPTADEIIGGTVRLLGTASDKNGIKKVQISLDNGNSFNDSELELTGADIENEVQWSYLLNTKIIPDGNHAVFIRVYDEYDISALYSCLLNVDNTPPELTVYTPSDGTETTGPLYFTGQVMDSMMLESVSIKLSSLEGVSIPPELAEVNLKLDALLLDEMDISSLPDGNYNVEVWAVDKAKNTSRTARNISLIKNNERNFIDVLYPFSGQYMNGNFNIYGYVGGLDKASQVTLQVNGSGIAAADVTEAGYFRFEITPQTMRAGANTLVISSDFGGRDNIQTEPQTIQYQPNGPWVTVDTMNMGDFAYERPWLQGRAGYELTDNELAILADKKTDKDIRADIEAKKVTSVELSFNNGLTFFPADKAKDKAYDWGYRLETGDMAEGLHYLVVRAVMANGEIAASRFLVQVDKTAPTIRLITPQPGGHYNTELVYSALTNDDVKLGSVSYYLRKGDKAFYEVPGFIKGLYFEATIPPFIKQIWNTAPSIFGGGATYMDISVGLSFFDDNVKLQAGYGIMTQGLYESLGGTEPVRYGGHVLGLKLLANIYQLPFASFLGPDWEWLSATFSLGANFSLFDLASEGYTQSGNPTWLSAVLAQIEFPRITIPKRSYLRTFSMFTEGQLWFVPTDVNATAYGLNTVIPHVIVGLRLYIF